MYLTFVFAIEPLLIALLVGQSEYLFVVEDYFFPPTVLSCLLSPETAVQFDCAYGLVQSADHWGHLVNKLVGVFVPLTGQYL